jgi:DMSO reductase anchor subunit
VVAATAARPPAVLWACVLTWICTAFVTVSLVASAVVLAVSPDLMLDEVHRDNPDLAAQGISDDVLLVATYVMIAGLVLWCVSAAGLAVLVLRGVDWARIVLVVSAATCAVLCLVGSAIGAFLLVFPLIASAVVIAMLQRADTREWSRRATPAGPPPPGAAAPPR